MKRLCFTSLIVGLLVSLSLAQNSGFVAVENWAGTIAYSGGIYLPGGTTIQAQFVGSGRSYYVAGYSWEMNGLYAELNGGVVVGESDVEIYNLSFQCNLAYGDNTSLANILMCNEYDPSVKKDNPNVLWMWHQYLFGAKRLRLGVCAEFMGEIDKNGNSFHLKPGPMLKYSFNEKIVFLFSPRASVMLERNAEFKQGDIYIGCIYSFNYGGK